MPLPGLPWSPEFMASYEQALAGQPIEIGAAKLIPGTMRALAVSYFNSSAFRSMVGTTQRDYRQVIERLCKEHGDKRAVTLEREHIVRLMGGCKANLANRLRKTLRAMMKHAVEIGMRADDPTRDTRAIRVKSDGYHSWTEPRSHNSRPAIRLARAPDSPSLCCYIRDSGAAMWCAWAANTSAMERFTFASRRPAPNF